MVRRDAQPTVKEDDMTTYRIKLTIAEPFPVMFSHVNFNQTDPGACYAAGSSWYHAVSERDYAERQAAYLRGAGYTVTIAAESRTA
jgi:hypothetical protein